MNRLTNQSPEALLSHVMAALPCTVHGEDGRILPAIELTLRSIEGKEHVAILNLDNAASLAEMLPGLVEEAQDLADKKGEAN